MSNESENPSNKPPTDYEVAMREKYASQAIKEDYTEEPEIYDSVDEINDYNELDEFSDVNYLVIDQNKLDNLDFDEVKKVLNHIAVKSGREPFTDEQIAEIIEKSQYYGDQFPYKP